MVSSENLDFKGRMNQHLFSGEQSKYKASLLNKKIEQKQETVFALNNLENQAIDRLADVFEKKPYILGKINKSIKIAIGKEPPAHTLTLNRERGR